MPFKSQAQRKFFHAAQERGDIPKSTVHEYDEKTKGKKLPEKLHPSKTVKFNRIKKMCGGGMM
jgi:hypothetical protein